MSEKIDVASRHITHARDNIFSDLGFPADKASTLLAESDAEIRQLKALKKQVMSEIAEWMQKENIKQLEAAQILRVTRPRVSDVVNYKTEKFTLDALLTMAGIIGKKFELVIKQGSA